LSVRTYSLAAASPAGRRSISPAATNPSSRLANTFGAMPNPRSNSREAGHAVNFDFDVSFTPEPVATGQSYNFRPLEGLAARSCSPALEGPGMSAFILEGDVVYHTYSAYARALDALWNMWQ
jgi:predicted dithiol-disulfide oxidoreductase (DUF899 family)